MNKNIPFISLFPNTKYRYLDLTGNSRPSISSKEKRNDLNMDGYCAFFTPNGFDGDTATKDKCTNLNAFFIDVDKKLTKEEIEKIKSKLEPTFITETFNGFHFYWVLDEVIYKEEVENWDETVEKWERIEQAIVDNIPDADKAVKDLPRILRLPDQMYWKKTGDMYKDNMSGAFMIKGIHKNPACRYSFEQMEEAFPPIEKKIAVAVGSITNEKSKKASEAEKKSFFEKVNKIFPLEERDSFQRLINGADDSTLPYDNCANNALVLTSSLMKQAGWSKEKAIKQIEKTGWHGIEKERGGWQEIVNTINSGYQTGYTYSYKNEIIAHNTSDEENQKLQETFTAVLKERKEKDKIRFSNYERELVGQHPFLKKNEIGIVFNYNNGVYKMMSDQEVSDMVLTGLYDDLLWTYRTKKNVSDKVACLLSILPELKITDDRGYIANVRNGLLNLVTGEFRPHDPNFVSLVQYDVDYDPEATCPTWKNCLEAWTKGEESEEKQLLLQQFSGYCLSSSTAYQKALFLVGDGGAGKSTFTDTLIMIMGEEATASIGLDSLYGQYGMKGIIGKRLNVIEEVHGNYYESDKLKKLISGEKVTIDIKYKDQFTFRPQVKFIFAVNLIPRVNDTSSATERRMCVVNFGNNFRNNPNTELRENGGLLIKEASGIFNWMIEGANKLREMKGFIITKEQTRMLTEYREENSSVEGFLSQCVVISENPEDFIEAPDLYLEYKKWSVSDGGRKIKANITFTKEVKTYGARDNKFTYSPREYSGRESRFTGIKLSPHWVAQKDSGESSQWKGADYYGL